MSKKLTRNRGRLLAIVVVVGVGVVFLLINTRLSQHEAQTGSLDTPTSGTGPVVSARWGKLTMGPVTGGAGRNPWTQIKSIFYRLRSHNAIRLPIGAPVNMDTAMNLYYMGLVPRPNLFVVYYSPGLDGGTTSLVPLSMTNSGKVTCPPASLDATLAFNGYRVVRLRRNVIKVFPSTMSRVYSEAPVNDPYPAP